MSDRRSPAWCRLQAATVMAAVLAACGQAASAPPAGTGAPSPTTAPVASAASPAAASASPQPAEASTAPPRPAGTLAWPTEFAVEMLPGTYFSSPPFALPLTIEIADRGWYAGHLNPVFVDLQRFDGVDVGSFPTRMLGIGWPETIRGETGPVSVEDLTPAAAFDLLASRGSVQAGERTEIELAALAGERLDLHSDPGNNAIFGTADGDFRIGPELDLRLVALPYRDGLLMLAVLAPGDDLNDAWGEALPMLESIELTD